jgi:putative cardiolipin synthase
MRYNAFMIRRFASLLTLLLLLSLTGCAPKGGCPRNVAWQRSKTDTPAPLRFATDRPLHGGSAFTTLSEPADAYAARLWLVDHARHTLDVQYYIFKDDAIGNDFL